MALFQVESYSPKDVLIFFDNKQLTGFSKGDFITVDRNEKAFDTIRGVAGEVCVTGQPDKSGRIRITLRQTASSNHFLTYRMIDQDLNTGIIPTSNITITDPSGSLMVTCSNCFIEEFPEVSLGGSQNDKEWVFFAQEITYDYEFIKTF